MFLSEELGDASEKTRILQCLGNTGQPELIDRTLQWVLDNKDVRSQDQVYVLGSCAANRKGTQATWEWLQANWDTMYKRWGGGFLVQRLAKLAQNFTTKEKAVEVSKFFESKKATSQAAVRAMDQCVETIETNASWAERAIPEVSKFLSELQS